MGYKLVREIMRGAPGGWDPTMRLVALAIADEANDATRRTIGYQAEGYWRPHGKGWRDGICEHTGLCPDGVTKALRRLAVAGYDMRVQAGEDKHGRPVYAFKGHATDYQVPRLPPRPEPQRVDYRAGIERQRPPYRPPKPGLQGDPSPQIPSEALSPQEDTASMAASRWPRDADDDTRSALAEELVTRLGADLLEGRIIEEMTGRGCNPRMVENTIRARRGGR
jgi:hypothetical protein